MTANMGPPGLATTGVRSAVHPPSLTPVHDVAWAPNGYEFIVISGAMPQNKVRPPYPLSTFAHLSSLSCS